MGQSLLTHLRKQAQMLNHSLFGNGRGR